MTTEELKRQYPEIELEELFPHFPRISPAEYPELSGISVASNMSNPFSNEFSREIIIEQERELI